MVARRLLRAFLSFVLLLRLVAALNGDGALSGDSSSSRVPPDLYHSSYALLKEVKDLVGRHPDLFMLETMRAGNKGYFAEMVSVTYNYMKNGNNDKLKFRVLLSFGQHGRELITTEVALHLLSVLAEENKLPGMEPKTAKEIVNNLVIKMVPMENLNGRRLVEAGEFCERRNGRGVDLNRNWSVDWGKKEKDYDPYEENPGIAPFSEPEAQIMRNLSLSFDPHIWINVHSGMEALFMPYDHKNSTPDGATSNLMRLLLNELNHRHFEDKCSVGSGGGLVGYLAHGTTTDYMFDVAKVPMSFTFEIYGDQTAPSKDCFKMFNPIDKVEFDKVINKWTIAFLALFEMAPRWLNNAHFQISSDTEKWIPIGGKALDKSLAGTTTERKMESLDLGLQELRTYFSGPEQLSFHYLRAFPFNKMLIMFLMDLEAIWGNDIYTCSISLEHDQPQVVHEASILKALGFGQA